MVRLPRITAVIGQARERGFLLQREVNHLHKVFLDSMEERTYQESLKSSRLWFDFEEPGWSEKDHYEKYMLFRFAALIDLFRPNELDWYTPNLEDMRLAQKLLRAFCHGAADNTQRAFIRKLFDAQVTLKELARARQRGLSPSD